MADVPNRWSDYLRRFFNLRGTGRADWTETIQPSVNLTEEAPWYALLRDEHHIMALVVVPAAGAGNYSTLDFSGTPNPDFTFCITRVLAMKAAAGHIVCGITTQPVATMEGALSGVIVSADQRAVQTNLTFGMYASFVGAVPTNPYDTALLAATMAPLYIPQAGQAQGVILPWTRGYSPASPGNTRVFRMANTTVNEAFTVLVEGTAVPQHGGEEVGMV